MPKENSSGIIAYFKDKEDNQYKFLVCKPGGPYFKNKFVYGFPKGHVEEGENLKQAALREFLEETGIDYIDYRKLDDNKVVSSVTGNKNFYFFLYETEEIWNLEELKSNLFYEEKFQEWFPENDDYKYMTLEQLEKQTFKYMDKVIKEIKTVFE